MINDVCAWLGISTPDPLVIVLVLFAVGAAASRLFFRNHTKGRVIVRVTFLILLTFALLHANITPYEPLRSTGSSLFDVVQAILKIAWWLWAAWFLVALSRAMVVVEHRPHEGQLLQDLISGCIYLAGLLAIVRYVFDLPIQGLLATSGVIAIILGLALQSTLGDVFSGVVLNFSRPYRTDDWVNIGGETSGRVLEINWRATHILTAQRDLAIIPNSTIAKSKIVNVSSPSGVHGITISVQVAPGPSPSIVVELLTQAVTNCRLILATPAPTISTNGLSAAYVEFEINFFVKDLPTTTRAQNELLDMVYRHLAFAGIDLATPSNGVVPLTSERPTRQPVLRPVALLEQMAIFATLSADEERAVLAPKLKRRSYRQGDILIEEGSVAHSLSLLASGVVSCFLTDEDPQEEVLRLGPGDHFGELGLLRGEPSILRMTALTPVVTYELSRDDILPLLEAHPEVAETLKRDLAQRETIVTPPSPAEVTPLARVHGLKGRVACWFHRRYDLTT
jgi:small-conductance mechanosensitive channel/CRP-like cAMP-binding protein